MGDVTHWNDSSIQAFNIDEVFPSELINLAWNSLANSSTYDVTAILRSMLVVDESPYSLAIIPWNQLSRIPSPRFSIAPLVVDNIPVIPTLDSIVNQLYPLTSLSYAVIDGTCPEVKEIVRFINYTLTDLEVRENIAEAGLGLSEEHRDEAIELLREVECDGFVMREAEQEIARDLLYNGYWAWESSRSFWPNLKEFFLVAPIGSSIYLFMYALLLVGSICVFQFSFRLESQAGKIQSRTASFPRDVGVAWKMQKDARTNARLSTQV